MLTYIKPNEVKDWRPEDPKMNQNALWNCKNPHQGMFKKVLTVCSAGLLRSPTIAWVLSQEPYNFNTRAAGTGDYALIQVDDVLLTWADEIVTVDEGKAKFLKTRLNLLEMFDKPVINLNIPDNYRYRDGELIELIKHAYDNPDEPEAA
jgi:predicted protein tyrosine phosphatase